MQKFQDSGAKVFAISTDPSPSQKAWAESLGLSFPLLSDFLDRKVSQEYGVYLPKLGFSNRVTFVIDREGKLVDRDVRGKELHDAILQALGETVSLTWKDHLVEFGSALVPDVPWCWISSTKVLGTSSIFICIPGICL